MKINIRSNNMELTAAITNYAKKKLEKLHKFLNDEGDREAIAQVTIGKSTKHHKEGELFASEATISFSGDNFTAQAKDEDLYASIDKLHDELEAEITRHNSKETDMVKKGGRAIKKQVRGL